MMSLRILCRGPAIAVLAAGLSVSPVARAQLQVVCTVPDLANLVEIVGGDYVATATFAKGTEDAHFVEAKPSFVRTLSRADALASIGLGLEDGWLPVLLQNCRNQAVQATSSGGLDASKAIQPLGIPTGSIDRSMGDVHAGGNPHYLLDPLCGVQVARRICEKLSELQPEQKAYFNQRYEAFERQVAQRLIGESLAKKYRAADIPKLALLHEHGKLAAYLKSQQEDSQLGGWLAVMLPYYGAKAVDDHNLWPYFARRFGLKIVAHMEPKPGMPPATLHLRQVAEQMRNDEVRLILANPYYDTRHANFLATNTGARVANVAHQVGSRPGAGDYLSLIDWNVRQVVTALGGNP